MAPENTFNDEENPKGVKFAASRLSITTNPFIPKQLEEFGRHMNSGVKNVEIGSLSMDKFESIPTQHLEEIRRLGQLTKTGISMHGPLIDLAGFGEQKWSDQNRKESEQQMLSVLKRTAALRSPEDKQPMPIVFHSSHHAFSGFYDKAIDEQHKKQLLDDLKDKQSHYAQQYERNKDAHPDNALRYKIKAQEYEKELKDYKEGNKKLMQAVGVVNQETGDINILQFKKRVEMTPSGERREVIFDPYQSINALNDNQWEDEITKMHNFHKQMDEIKERLRLKQQQLHALESTGLKDSDEEEYKRMYEANGRDINLMNQHINSLKRDMNLIEIDLFDKFEKWAPKDEKKIYWEDETISKNKKEIKDLYEKSEKAREEYQKKLSETKDEQESNRIRYEANHILEQMGDRMEKLKMENISNMPAPELWKPIEDFAQEKMSETVSNAMVTFIKENKDLKIENAPMLAIENPFPTLAMSNSETLRKGIEKTRDKFIEKIAGDKDFAKKCQKEGVNPKDKAKDIAKKLIGATWDMGHINMLRKAGYTEEELKKQVIKETEKISDLVKHLHITDNFGFADSHLPPGMGNVPIKEVFEELEKKGFLGRAVSEVGGFVNEFSLNPQHAILEYFKSPIYGESAAQEKPALGSPYWKKEYPNVYADTYIEFPQQHFNLYSSSFSTLPKTFGGQVGADRSRFSDTPNQ